MDQKILAESLVNLPVAAVRYFRQVGSTNDEARRWAAEGAPDSALVFADEQTSGRGRVGRTWVTPPSTALAFSLIFRPTPSEAAYLGRWTALGALAVHNALHSRYQLPAEIKWPNDVLVHDRKLCGVLVETQWDGSDLTALILGIGINVASASVSEDVLPASSLRFPATSVESEAGGAIDRLALLGAVLVSLFSWRERLGTPEFLQAWESSLAFQGEWVQVETQSPPGEAEVPAWAGILIGLTSDGSLLLKTESGEEVTVRVGDIRLRRA